MSGGEDPRGERPGSDRPEDGRPQERTIRVPLGPSRSYDIRIAPGLTGRVGESLVALGSTDLLGAPPTRAFVLTERIGHASLHPEPVPEDLVREVLRTLGAR